MNELMNVETMGTYAGLLMTTMMLTEMFKTFFELRGWSVRYLAYVIALIFVTGFTWTGYYPQDILLYIVNAAVVALAAMGGSGVLKANAKDEDRLPEPLDDASNYDDTESHFEQ